MGTDMWKGCMTLGKTGIFPLNQDIPTLLSYGSGPHDIVISSFYEDASRLKTLEQQLGVSACVDYESFVRQCKCIYLLEGFELFSLKPYLEILRIAKENKVNCFVSPVVQKRLLDETETENDWFQTIKCDHSYTEKEMYNRVRELEAPVIMVYGLGEHSGKFECMLRLKQTIDNEGYDGAFLSGNSVGALAGIGCYPEELFSENISHHNKVLLLNKFLFNLDQEQKPDVIVLSVPGGTVSLSEGTHNFYCELPLVFSSAVTADAGILCCYLSPERTKEFYRSAESHIDHRYGFPMDLVFFSTTRIKMRDDKFTDYLFCNNGLARSLNVPDPGFLNSASWDSNNQPFHEILNGLRGNLMAI